MSLTTRASPDSATGQVSNNMAATKMLVSKAKLSDFISWLSGWTISAKVLLQSTHKKHWSEEHNRSAERGYKQSILVLKNRDAIEQYFMKRSLHTQSTVSNDLSVHEIANFSGLSISTAKRGDNEQ
ncbi:hypothetical protein [Calycomorphotria hydatis]|uniref:hypothetical protein n=1 Tax=Calycomorphotria hydatis TaxID=2528027 RepID=UPI0018D210DC|nr:hypothetical protein [Calycomorphotria hydatis]